MSIFPVNKPFLWLSDRIGLTGLLSGAVTDTHALLALAFVRQVVSRIVCVCVSEPELIPNSERKKKSKVKRKKTLDKTLNVIILSYGDENREVECRLELSNTNTITFMFAPENDHPEEIAENLVSLDVSLFATCVETVVGG